MKWSFLALLLLGVRLDALPQAMPQAPAPMHTVLGDMSTHAKALGKAHKELRDYAHTIDFAASWLRERVSEKDPVDYRLQLTLDGYLLDRAMTNPDEASAIMKSVAVDLDLKNRDCYRFGHGRRVPLEIRTMRGGVEEGGWQILYRWLPPNNLPVQVMELSFPSPSSPSTWDLPVGMYEFHIEKKDASGALQKSTALIIPVDLVEKGSWRLQIP